MALFQKGVSGNPGGRPKIASWTRLEYWFTELQKDLKDERLSPRDRVNAELRCIEIILEMKPAGPKTPTESLTNAKYAMKALQEMANSGRKAQTDGRKNGVADRRPDVQAVEHSKVDAGGLGSEQVPQ